MKRSLRQILSNLPPRLKQAFYSEQTSNIIKDAALLGQIQSNDEEKLNIIEGDVLNVILGRSPLATFTEKLKTDLGISETNITIISKIIQEKLFDPLSEDLNNLPVNHSIPSAFKTEKIEPRKIKVPSPPLRTPTPKQFSASIQRIKSQELNNIPSPKIKSPSLTEKQDRANISRKQKTYFSEYKTKQEKSKTSFSSTIPKQLGVEEKLSSLDKRPIPHLPEPAEVEVKKPELRTKKLKNISIPTIPLDQQEKIKNKLLAAMKRKTAVPKIVETIKKLSREGWKNIKSAPPKKENKPVQLDTAAASQVIFGEENNFSSSNSEQKKNLSPKKPFIFNVNLKQKTPKKKTSLNKKPISYSKYKPSNPFGNA